MQTALPEVQIGRPPEAEELDRWYQEHDLAPDKNGIFTGMPYEHGPVERQVILDQVAQNALRHEIPNARPVEYNARTFVYIGGGPSLKNHLDEIKAKCLDDKYDVYTSNATAK